MRKPIKPYKPIQPSKYVSNYRRITYDKYTLFSLKDVLDQLKLSISDIDLDKLKIQTDIDRDYIEIVITYPEPLENEYYEKELKTYEKKKKQYDKKLKKYKEDLVEWQKWKDKDEKDKRKKLYTKLKNEFELDELLKTDHGTRL